jgi:antitoxin (DNA-binding transcriptional repressor) of toxin-antitoxin stability system
MGTTCIPAMMLRQRTGDLLARVHFAGERFVIERHGEAVAALVSIDDLHRLEAADQRSAVQRTQRQEALSQVQAVREAILARCGGTPLPYSTGAVRRLREERADALAGLRGY